jgi:hypothetical protein
MLKTQQEGLAAGSGFTYADGLTNDQMLLSALITTKDPATGKPWVPATGRAVEEQVRYARGRLEFDRLVQEEMRRQGVPKLSNPDRQRILGEMLTSGAYLDRRGVFSGPFRGQPVSDSLRPVFMMSPEELNTAFLPLDTEDALADSITLPNGRELAPKEWLIGFAMNDPNDPAFPGLGLPVRPTKKNLERAYFAWKHDLGDEEVERRLRGE